MLFSRASADNSCEDITEEPNVGGRFNVAEEMNMLALVKGEEKYVFLFNDKNRSTALRQLGKYASDPDLSFTWYDAAVLSQKIRATTDQPVRRFEDDALLESADSNDPDDIINS